MGVGKGGREGGWEGTREGGGTRERGRKGGGKGEEREGGGGGGKRNKGFSPRLLTLLIRLI